MLNIHYSNRLEALAGQLAEVTRVPLTSALSPELIVVQSHGVARWLALQLARHSGVCANVRFPFPAEFAWTLYRALDDLPSASPFEKEAMAWRIMQVLPALEAAKEFAPVQGYVANEILRRYELARRVAETFEQYLVYRPDWLQRWEAGRTPHWQARLWKRVVEHAGAPHRAALHRQLLAHLDAGLLARAGVPARVSVFGAPALPPMLLELFAALASHIEVHLFILNPCREYWGDIAGGGEIARKTLAQRPEAGYLETGNSLLASLGKQGRDFIDLLQNYPSQEHELYIESGDDDLLSTLQSDVLNLRERRTAGGIVELAPDDRSVQVHACHSAMREAEVLHDQLLALLERHSELQPPDIVVMTPDIEAYAPYIEAVFSTTEPHIPFNISDRSAERESPIAATFMALLELPGSRYEASRVLEILDEPAVQRRFALTTGDIDVIRRWVRESGIRWGIDAAHRAGFDLPETAEHTWRFGLDRLLLGYALPGGNERLFADILPYDEVEGTLGQVLGRFVSFADAAIALNDLRASRTVPQWTLLLRSILAKFYAPDEDREEEMEALRSAIGTLESEAAAGGFDGAIPLDVLKGALRSRLEIPARAFLSGGVTFCAMVPMRSLPFEAVCLIGMNDAAFPRTRRPYGFDLLATDFRKGDRSRREDDRYLFLESLLSARRCFYVSYTGQHIRDNSVIPSSVLVSELLDYLARNFRGPAGADIRNHVLTPHPLQPFSARYFDGNGKLFSYSAALCQAAKLAGRDTGPQPFLSKALPEPEPEWRTIELESLIRFFRNPARYFVRERLGIRLEAAEEELDGREPLTSESLELYALKQRLLAVCMRGEPVASALAAARGSALLPHAQVGATLFEKTGVDVERFAGKLMQALPEKTPAPVSVDLELGEMRLRGVLTGVSAEGLLGYRLAKCQPKDLLAAWIRHLVLNALAPPGVALLTRWFLQDTVVRISSVPEARTVLHKLVQLYWAGLQRPLHLFPQSAQTYVDKNRSIDAARRTWMVSDHNRSEGEDPYYRLAFRDCDPLDDEFEELALAVFGPMKAAMVEERSA